MLAMTFYHLTNFTAYRPHCSNRIFLVSVW